MDSIKENLLKSTWDDLVKVALRGEDIGNIDGFIDKDFMAYGTAPDEKIFGEEGFRRMIEKQRLQWSHSSPEINQQIILRKCFGQGNTALSVGEILIKVKDEEGTNNLIKRLTSVFEYDGNKWLLLHFHCSTPDTIDQEDAPWLEKEWKRENADLKLKINQKTSELEQTILALKSTQEKLIQQEKLASLGQLTAGIAHEIKNPLNFVNNFSDLNVELIEEIFEKLKKLDQNEIIEEIGEILLDVKFNLKKIYHHGTRADGIVKSMLQHSRGGSGKVEPTDLNTLIKEYVNLAFHGMRAGKKAINVSIDFQLDANLGMVPLIAEDFSRVVLNLCNNAFDAMREKLSWESHNGNYTAKLTIRTGIKKGQVQIQVEDNGPGIPENYKDKVLLPFFTTKKGTEGTGLGLSITHDIIKAHKGKLRIVTKKGSFTRFNILLPHPLNKNT